MRQRIRRIATATALAMLVSLTVQVTSQQAANAAGLITCNAGSGEINISPPYETNAHHLSITGSAASSDCDGFGVVAASTAFIGTVFNGFCVEETQNYFGTLAVGTLTISWDFASDPDRQTRFSWEVPAGLQISPEQTELVLEGHSYPNDWFHPAEVEFTVTFSDFDHPCPGTAHASIGDVRFAALVNIV